MTAPADPASPAIARTAPFAFVITAYASIGLSEGSVGAVWPRMAQELALDPTGQILLSAPFAVGFVAAALPHGRILRWLHSGQVLAAAAAFGVVGAVLISVAPGAAGIAAGFGFLGLAGGGVDAALSSHGSVHFTPRRILLMQGGFGVGAFSVNFLVTAIVSAGGSWRLTYGGIALLEGLLVVAWLAVLDRWPQRAEPSLDPEPPTEGPADGSGAGVAARASRTLVVACLACFFLYTGAELAVGNWSKTLLIQRGIPEVDAGLAASSFFFALMAGRFLLGLARAHPGAVVTVAAVSALVGAVALGSFGASSTTIGFVALPWIGLSLAGVFPSLVALTSSRVGAERAPSIMGAQLACASAGAAIIPALIGLAAGVGGSAAIGTGIGVAVGALLVAHVVTVRLAGERFDGRPVGRVP